MTNNEGRVAIITGAAQGIGYATAMEFALLSYRVVIADLNKPLADSVSAGLNEKGCQSLAVEVDVANRSSVERMMSVVLDQFRRIDVLVNNAGIAGRASPLMEVTDDEWDMMMTVDVKSIFLCCRAVLPQMLEQRAGAIVNVASIAGKEGNPNMVPYSTAKAGVIGLTKALAKEVAQQGVRVNAVAPAVVETNILETLTAQQVDYMKSKIPMNRFCRTEEVANVIAFLASDKASFVTGQCYDVSGGRATY